MAHKERQENTRDLYNGPAKNCARIDLSSQVLANIAVACIYTAMDQNFPQLMCLQTC